MRLEGHGDASAFLAAAGPVLGADEARHNLIYGICSTAIDMPDAFPHARFWTVGAGQEVVAAALRTPPFNIVVAQPLDPEALPFAARELHDHRQELPGVTGAIPEVETFAREWERLAGCSLRVRMSLGLYAARAVVLPEGVPGSAREAGEKDRELVLAWLREFEREAMAADAVRQDHAEWFDRRLRSATAGLALWEDDGETVSLCGYGGMTPRGIRIGPVYTPPELRRRGYASAVTAHVTKNLLGGGRDFCFLYTDLANPTSNKIYMDIGYQRVCDSAEYAFDNP
jgi:uncharacterized protein